MGPEKEQLRPEVGLQTEGPESAIREEERQGSEGVRSGLNIRAIFVYKQTNKPAVKNSLDHFTVSS